jgi:hypothetical protein
MAMDKQMELFDDGGLMEEGGMVDEVSGNEVPPGSTREEVRDDIPAQLSEGEFVFPADVVRYIGLENLMRMRQEAKMGLAQMEAMGQMGNSEEATMPDDLPFDMYDLEVEDDGVQDFAQGGVVQAQAGTFVQPQGFTGIGGYQPSQFANYQSQYTPYTPPSMPAGQQLTQQYTPVTQQTVPTMTQQVPTFTAFTGMAAPGTGGYDEMKTYVNDAGMEMQIPFKDGNPIYPIPEGYSLKGDAVKTAQTTTTTGTGTETAQVQDSGGDDSSDPFAGKNTVRLGGEVYKGPSGFVGDGVKSRRTTGEVVGSKQFAVGTTSSATGDLSKSGIVGSIKDTISGILDQDQRTLTDQFGNSVAMSKGMYDTLVSEKTSKFTNDIINSIFETQKTIEENFGENYSKNLDNRQAKQFAKELGIDYKGQSLAELMVVNKEAFEAEKKAAKEKPSQERPSQEEQAKAAGERRKAEAQAAAASLPKGYKIDTTGKSATEILNEVREQKAKKERDDATRAAEAARNYQYYDSSGDYQGPDPFGGTGVSSGTDFGGTGYETSTGEAMVAEGGLMNKNKLSKQMEKSGLTPKK